MGHREYRRLKIRYATGRPRNIREGLAVIGTEQNQKGIGKKLIEQLKEEENEKIT